MQEKSSVSQRALLPVAFQKGLFGTSSYVTVGYFEEYEPGSLVMLPRSAEDHPKRGLTSA